MNKTKRAVNIRNSFNLLLKFAKNESTNKWRNNNKENYKEYGKAYYQNNKEKMKEKITCECGSIIRKSNLSPHKKTKKHFNLMKK